MSALISAKGFEGLARYFTELPEQAELAGVLAINQTATRSLSPIKAQMRSEINFPNGYLEDGRLAVTRKATAGSLEAVIRGRDRATSLARFAAGQTPANTRKRGVFVEVKKGKRQQMKSAFLVNLKNGNIGLAVRLKPGQSLRNSEKAVRLANNVFLLYGPSVDQVFSGVVEQQIPTIDANLRKEWFRQFTRLSSRG